MGWNERRDGDDFKIMLVYLMRHGIAIDHDDPECPPDPERHLTPKGIEKTRTAAHGLRAMKVNPDLVLSSPYLRAMQTAEIACIALDIPVSRIRKTDALLSGASPLQLVDELIEIEGRRSNLFRACAAHGRIYCARGSRAESLHSIEEGRRGLRGIAFRFAD